MLPKGWRHSSIGECTKFLSGNTPSKENLAYWSGDFPWVTVKDMKTPWIYSTGLGLTESGKAASSVAPANSILVVTRGMALLKDLPVSMATRDVAFNQDIKAIVPKDYLDSRFFALQLLSRKHDVLGLVDTAGHGTGKLDTDLLKSVKIVLPPLPEQRHIAKIFATWDQVIATTERLLTNSRKQKQALTHSLLGDRLRKISGKKALHREHASAIFLPRSTRNNDGLELLSVMQDVGVVPRSSLDRKVVMPEGSTNGYKLMEPGDFVISLRSFEGGLEYSKFKGLVSPAYTVLTSKRPIVDDFYRHYFKSTDFIGRLAVAVIGIRDGKQISYEDFAFLRLSYPSVPEQQEIAQLLNAAEVIIQKQEVELLLLKQEKVALMAQLLTGKRRVHVPDVELEAQT